MKGIIEVLVEEHDEILKFIEQLRKKCLGFMEDDIIDIEGLRQDIQFIRIHADLKHHQKEEKILFRAMLEHLGELAVKLIQHGMLVEHDLARLHVSELEKAVNSYEVSGTAEDKLDIIANAMSYCYLLHRHIDKENNAVYPFAEKQLSSEVMRQLDLEAEEYAKDI